MNTTYHKITGAALVALAVLLVLGMTVVTVGWIEAAVRWSVAALIAALFYNGIRLLFKKP